MYVCMYDAILKLIKHIGLLIAFKGQRNLIPRPQISCSLAVGISCFWQKNLGSKPPGSETLGLIQSTVKIHHLGSCIMRTPLYYRQLIPSSRNLYLYGMDNIVAKTR